MFNFEKKIVASINKLKKMGIKVYGYGATSKSTT